MELHPPLKQWNLRAGLRGWIKVAHAITLSGLHSGSDQFKAWQYPDYPDKNNDDLPHSLHANASIISHDRPRPLSSTSSPIHCLLSASNRSTPYSPIYWQLL